LQRRKIIRFFRLIFILGQYKHKGVTMRKVLFPIILFTFLIISSCIYKGLNVSDNAILTIKPYWYNGTWVFDDERVNLYKEPFVAGIPEMISHIIKDIPNAKSGFRLLFSAQPFPGYQMKLTWRRKEKGGNWYLSEELRKEGWLCPALFKYYKKAPKELYAKAEPIKE